MGWQNSAEAIVGMSPHTEGLTHYEWKVGLYLRLELADASWEGSQHMWKRRNLGNRCSAIHSGWRLTNGTKLARKRDVGTAGVRNRMPGGVGGRRE